MANAINANAPVIAGAIPTGSIVQQYVGSSGVGHYFSFPGATPLQLGIKPDGRVSRQFITTTDVSALISTTEDDYMWPPGAIVPGSGAGGAVQFYVPDTTGMDPL
jgi:hypothetical protein